MAFHPYIGMDLWVTLAKIKIKKVKIKHFPSFRYIIEHIRFDLSRGISDKKKLTLPKIFFILIEIYTWD